MAHQGKYPRVSDLTRAQNERLRRAMLAYRVKHCGDSTTELATRLHRSQPSISDFLNAKGGASYVTASRFAKLVKADVTVVIGDPDPADGEMLPDGATEPAFPDMPMGTLLILLRDRPGLYSTVTKEPGRWRVSTVIRAVGETFQSDTDGVPIGGWPATLDAIQAGASPVRREGNVRADTQRQVGRRAALPPKPKR